MMENLDGTWNLQLIADRRGDGVTFFNTTRATQEFFISDMSFSAKGTSGLFAVNTGGEIQMEDSTRVLRKAKVRAVSGVAAIVSIFGGGNESGFLGSVVRDQQIMCVDSVLLITRSPPGEIRDKEHFCVWRRTTTGSPSTTTGI